MTLWKKAVALLLAAAMMVPLALAAPSTEGSFSDVEDHWAQAEIEKAVATGWVDGYPDGTFKPEKTITRAEFTKMILDATHLTPGCETVAWMKDHAKIKVKGTGPWPDTVDYEPRLNDMDDHWLTTQGWTEAALYSGMVVPSDYNGGNFRPEKPIARYEIALMVTRALGQVYEAKQEEGLDLAFTDNEEILDWMKGYVDMASKAGVVQGYPDNSFRPNKASTRAEAVVMVQRMLDEMEQGQSHTGRWASPDGSSPRCSRWAPPCPSTGRLPSSPGWSTSGCPCRSNGVHSPPYPARGLFP